MIVEMQRGVDVQQVDGVVQRAKSLGFQVQLNLGTDKVVVAILGGNTGQLPTETFAVLPGVESVTRIMKPYKLASREFKGEDSLVNVGKVQIGWKRVVGTAGPCAAGREREVLGVGKGGQGTGAVGGGGRAF